MILSLCILLSATLIQPYFVTGTGTVSSNPKVGLGSVVPTGVFEGATIAWITSFYSKYDFFFKDNLTPTPPSPTALLLPILSPPSFPQIIFNLASFGLRVRPWKLKQKPNM